jgi:molybdopterin converting factor small subunit
MDVKVQLLASTRTLLQGSIEEGTVVGLTIGNMVADLYERAEYLGLALDHRSLLINMEYEPVETDTVETVAAYKVRAEMKAMPR